MTPRLRPGQRIGPGYEIASNIKVTQGGMAEVYCVRRRPGARADPLYPQVAAAKVAFAQYDGDLKQEARLLSRCHHPRIVRILPAVAGTNDFNGWVDDAAGERVPFYLMEYIPGLSVEDYLAVKGRFPLRQALQIVRRLCEALAYLHQQGIMHLDIKPGNVMLRRARFGNWLRDPNVVLIDLGIARELSRPNSGKLAGTEGYTSPEQLRMIYGDSRVRLDARSDIFSTGVLFFHILTGGLPFASPAEVVDMNRPAPRLRDSGYPASQAVEAIVSTAMQKSPAARYATAESMLAAVEAVRLPLHRGRLLATAMGGVLVAAGLSVLGGPSQPGSVLPGPTLIATAPAAPAVTGAATTPPQATPLPRSSLPPSPSPGPTATLIEHTATRVPTRTPTRTPTVTPTPDAAVTLAAPAELPSGGGG